MRLRIHKSYAAYATTCRRRLRFPFFSSTTVICENTASMPGPSSVHRNSMFFSAEGASLCSSFFFLPMKRICILSMSIASILRPCANCCCSRTFSNRLLQSYCPSYSTFFSSSSTSLDSPRERPSALISSLSGCSDSSLGSSLSTSLGRRHSLLAGKPHTTFACCFKNSYF